MEYIFKIQDEHVNILDVIRSDESLRNNLNVCVGSRIDKLVSTKRIFDDIFSGLVKGTILSFECRDGKYFFEWIDESSQNFQILHAEISIQDITSKFVHRMNWYKSLFDEQLFMTEKRAARKILNNSSDPELRDSLTKLKQYRRTGDTTVFGDSMSEEYEQIKKYRSIIRHYSFNDPVSVLFKKFFFVSMAIILSLLFGGLVELLMEGQIVTVLFGIPSFGIISFFFHAFSEHCMLHQNDKMLANIIKKLEPSIESETKTKKAGFVDWIDKDLNFLKRLGEDPGNYVRELENLACDYSAVVNMSLAGENVKLNRRAYCNYLLDIEAELYGGVNMEGFKKGGTFITEQRLHEMIEFLGYNSMYGVKGYIDRMSNLIAEVCRMNYEGCEKEICLLIKTALAGIENAHTGDAEVVRKLLEEEYAILKEANSKRVSAEQAEHRRYENALKRNEDGLSETLDTPVKRLSYEQINS